jgi:subtilisin family serine protease
MRTSRATVAPTPAPNAAPPRRIPNQAIVSGPRDQVDRLAGLVAATSGYTVEPLALYQSGRGEVKAVKVLYQPGPGEPADSTGQLNRYLLDTAIRNNLAEIRTEPNCTTSTRPAWQGDPYSWEGNPFPGDGNAYAWEGNPYAQPQPQAAAKVAHVVPAGASVADGQALFAQQDAFARIQVAESGKRIAALGEKLGQGVQVAIFDTCPTDQDLAALKAGPLPWLHPHWNAPLLPAGEYSDHGLFIASLINFVAPSADIHLYQVLGGDVFGDTATLVKAMGDFLNSTPTGPAVISLSLGSMCCDGGAMPAVEGLIWEAQERGMVICAAAGNNGRRALKAATIPPAQMPAALRNVIAVAAANRQDIRASYSNLGDIAAPGGETAGAAGPNGFDDIIGLGTVSPSGYVRMDCGTSFATPLVAGAAALVLADLVERGAALDSGMWRRVYDRLALGAVPPAGEPDSLNTTGLGAGVIRVGGRNSIYGC